VKYPLLIVAQVDPVAACAGQPDGTPCDDGIECTDSSTCQSGVCVSERPNCRDEASQSDNSFCELPTGQCVEDTECPPFLTDAEGNENKYTISAGVDPETGLCIYQPKVCAATGCNLESCNPATGDCAVQQNNPSMCGPTGQICLNADFDGTACDVFSCAYTHCRFTPGFPSNCFSTEMVDCAALNPSTCQVSLGCDPSQAGATLGSGCQYEAVACDPPTDPCMELVMDGTDPNCCTYQPKDCAGRFGNDPDFTYSCEVVGEEGVCQATPIAPSDSDGDGVPDDEDECSDSDLSPTVVIDGCDSGVPNSFNILGTNGCTISDLIGQIADGASNHGQFVSGVSGLTNQLKKAGVITGRQKGAIQSCAGQSNIP